MFEQSTRVSVENETQNAMPRFNHKIHLQTGWQNTTPGFQWRIWQNCCWEVTSIKILRYIQFTSASMHFLCVSSCRTVKPLELLSTKAKEESNKLEMDRMSATDITYVYYIYDLFVSECDCELLRRFHLFCHKNLTLISLRLRYEIMVFPSTFPTAGSAWPTTLKLIVN